MCLNTCSHEAVKPALLSSHACFSRDAMLLPAVIILSVKSLTLEFPYMMRVQSSVYMTGKNIVWTS